MTGRGVIPSKQILQRWEREGLNTQQMADRVYELTGERVTRNAISVARARYDLPPLRPRYDTLLPWRVRTEHAMANEARLLRREERRRRGGEINPVDLKTLNNWLEELRTANAVVDYDPSEGFVYRKRRASDKDIIRRPEPKRRLRTRD